LFEIRKISNNGYQIQPNLNSIVYTNCSEKWRKHDTILAGQPEEPVRPSTHAYAEILNYTEIICT